MLNISDADQSHKEGQKEDEGKEVDKGNYKSCHCQTPGTVEYPDAGEDYSEHP